MGANAFADSKRALKVAALVRYMDRRYTGLGYHPYTQAGEIAAELRDKLTAADWAQHAVLAGVKKPSADSVAMVINEFEKRAATPPMARLGGVH